MEQSQDKLYKYQPLNKADEIRVLELNATKRRIEIRIRHVPLSSHVFQALSYVWGKPDQADEAVVLDELGSQIGWIPLTQNLGSALREIRDTLHLESKVFWIDQICINQRDEKEKNHQVAMMSQIYTQAGQVITYLGRAGQEVEENRGNCLLKQICRTISEDLWQRMHKAGSIQRIRDWILEERIHFKGLPPDLQLVPDRFYDKNEISKQYVEQGWEWLVHVAYGEWTQRLWIVQEQLLNRSVTALRGHRLIDWDEITAIPILFAIAYLPQQYREIGRTDLGDDILPWDQVEDILYGIWWDRRARLEPGTSYTWSSLIHNLQWYQPLLCGDARDRVYAILAISQDAEELGLDPDYSPFNTADVIAKQLSIRVLEKALNLESLNFALSSRGSDSALPSWCLTLDRSTNANTHQQIPLEVYVPHPKKYGFYLARFPTNQSTLVVKGQILDYVSTPSSSIAWPPYDDTDIFLQMKFFCSLLSLLSEGVPLAQIASSLLRTITARSPWSPPPSTQLSVDEIMAFHLRAYLRHKQHLLADLARHSPIASEEMLERCDAIFAKNRALTPSIACSNLQSVGDLTGEEHIAIERVLKNALERGRRLGRTRAGRLFNAIHSVEKDDAIVTLQGADRLFSIRPVGNTYTLVGDMFVDGLMHGEAYENQDPSKVDYDIELT